MDFTTLWTSDFLSGTHPLTPEQRGVYITPICHFIDKDRVVPDNDRHLARICNMGTRRYRTVRGALIDGDFISVRDGHIWIEKSANQWKKDAKFSSSQRVKAEKKHRLFRANALEQHNSGSAGAGAGACATPSPSLKNEEEGADAPRLYAFEGRVIRLKSADLERWRAAYHNISNIEGELTNYDDYLVSEGLSNGDKWFQRTSAWLAKKDAEFAAKPKGGERVAAI